jgi:hypothetical protein
VGDDVKKRKSSVPAVSRYFPLTLLSRVPPQPHNILDVADQLTFGERQYPNFVPPQIENAILIVDVVVIPLPPRGVAVPLVGFDIEPETAREGSSRKICTLARDQRNERSETKEAVKR